MGQSLKCGVCDLLKRGEQNVYAMENVKEQGRRD